MIDASAHEKKDVWAENEQHKQWVSEEWFASVQRKCSWLTVTRHSKKYLAFNYLEYFTIYTLHSSSAVYYFKFYHILLAASQS